MKYFIKKLATFIFVIMLVQTNILSNEILSGNEVSYNDQQDTAKVYLIDEVVITGTRTAKKIIDVPYPIQKIDNYNFKFDSKIAVDNVLNDVPGLFMQNRYGNHDVRISIRGFGSRSNSGIRGVRILLDGIPESEPDGQTRIEAIDFNSIGSIEVVRGNLSSLYTNAPGGVINFLNDINFDKNFFVNFNEIGSYGLSRNGFKTGMIADNFKFLLTYSYHNYKGYRAHSQDYWHIINSIFQATPDPFTKVNIYTYYVDGLIKLPGSLTKAQFNDDPYQANPRDISRDTRRVSKKGRLGISYNKFFGENKNNEFELTGYIAVKNFERTAKDFRIMNRNVLGASARYINHTHLFELKNEFSLGGDLFLQYGPVETYDNINGRRGDGVKALVDDRISNAGFYILNSTDLIQDRLSLLLSGRFDKVKFEDKDRGLDARSDNRKYEAFTPKIALNYKILPSIALFASYGLSFDSPAGNELDNYPTSSTYPKLLNPDLKAQKSTIMEIGSKGNLLFDEWTFFNKVNFEAAVFNYIIKDEIVPFDVAGVGVFYRNAAKTNRFGIELGSDVDIYKNLNFKLSYAFSNFKYDEYVARIDSITKVIDIPYSGKYVPSVPKHNLYLAVSYEQPLLEDIVGFVKVSDRFVSSMYVNDANTEETESYQLLNFLIGTDIKLGKFNIMLSGGVNNLLNKKYVGFININSDRKEYYEAGEPRNYFGILNIGYSF